MIDGISKVIAEETEKFVDAGVKALDERNAEAKENLREKARAALRNGDSGKLKLYVVIAKLSRSGKTATARPFLIDDNDGTPIYIGGDLANFGVKLNISQHDPHAIVFKYTPIGAAMECAERLGKALGFLGRYADCIELEEVS